MVEQGNNLNSRKSRNKKGIEIYFKSFTFRNLDRGGPQGVKANIFIVQTEIVVSHQSSEWN